MSSERSHSEPSTRGHSGLIPLYRTKRSAPNGVPHWDKITPEQARQTPDCNFWMAADSGCELLMVCAASIVHADVHALGQLLADLESITWRVGVSTTKQSAVESDMYYKVGENSAPFPVDWLDRSGLLVGEHADGLWLDRELAVDYALREPIQRVLTGLAPRLEVPPGFPCSFSGSLEMARRFPRAWLHLWSAHLNGDFASFELSRVRAEEHTLIAMLHEIEALLVAESIPDKYESDGDGVWPTSLRYSIPQRSTAEANRRWYAISCDHVLQRLHNDIVAVMEGRAASLGH